MQKRIKEVKVRLTVQEHKKLKKLSLEMNRPMSHVIVELLRKTRVINR